MGVKKEIRKSTKATVKVCKRVAIKTGKTTKKVGKKTGIVVKKTAKWAWKNRKEILELIALGSEIKNRKKIKKEAVAKEDNEEPQAED